MQYISILFYGAFRCRIYNVSSQRRRANLLFGLFSTNKNTRKVGMTQLVRVSDREIASSTSVLRIMSLCSLGHSPLIP